MKKNKTETERKTKNRINYLTNQISKNEQDIENLSKESQKWKIECNGSTQREENFQEKIEKLNRKIQKLSMALEEKEKEQFLLNDFVEKKRETDKKEEEKKKDIQNNEDNNYLKYDFRLSEGVKKKLEFFMNGKDIESNLEEKFWRFLMYEMESENLEKYESNRTSEIMPESYQGNEAAEEEELLWDHYMYQREQHQKLHHQRTHNYYDPRSSKVQQHRHNNPISTGYPFSQQQQQQQKHHQNLRFGTQKNETNPYSLPSTGSITLNQKNSSMKSQTIFSHYVKNMQNMFQIKKNDKILILGENDFSLTKALLAFVENPRNIFSTCYAIDQRFVNRMEQNLPCNVIQNINPISVTNNMFTFQFKFILFFFPVQSDADSIHSFFMHIYDFLSENNGQIFLALHKNANITDKDLKQIMKDCCLTNLHKENFENFWEQGLKYLGYQPQITSEMVKAAVVYSCTKF